MPNENAMKALNDGMPTLLGLFDEAGITLNDQERESFRCGLLAFAKINVDLFNWSLLGQEDFAEMAPRRFAQIWHSFVKRNPEFIVLVNRLKQGLQEATVLAETPSAGEA